MPKVRESVKVSVSKNESLQNPKDIKALDRAGFEKVGVVDGDIRWENKSIGWAITFTVKEGRYWATKLSIGKNIDCETLREALLTVKEDVEKEKRSKVVFLEIGGYEIETEVVACGNRKRDIANGLSWLVKIDDMIDGDTGFAEEVTKWIDGIAKDLIKLEPENKNDWKAWASATKKTLDETLNRTTLKSKSSDKNPNLIIHFQECEIETPIKMTDNFKMDLVRAYEYIAGDPSLLEDDEPFLNEFVERIKTLSKELTYAKVKVADGFTTWDSWYEEVSNLAHSTQTSYIDQKKKSEKKDSKVKTKKQGA